MRLILAILCFGSAALFGQVPIGDLQLQGTLQTLNGKPFSGKASLDQDGLQSLYFYKKGILQRTDVWVLDQYGKRVFRKSSTARVLDPGGLWYLKYSTWYSNGQLESRGSKWENTEIEIFNCKTFTDKGLLLSDVTYKLDGSKDLGRHYWAHPDGKKKREILILEEGNRIEERRWFNNGQLESEELKDSAGTGTSRNWYADGQISHESTTIKKQYHGTMKSWHPNGQLRAHTEFDNGMHKDGSWSTWYEDGTKQSEASWKDGKRDGLFQTWYQNGDLMTRQNYQKGQPHGEHQQWYKENVPMERKSYVHGKLNGDHKKYWPNGALRMKSVFAQGEPTDTSSSYTIEGVLYHEVIYQNQDSIVITKKYYKNGNPMSLRTEKVGMPHGIQRDYYENGQLQKEENYQLYLKPAVFRSKEGTWRVWDENGNLILTREFEKNVLVKKIEHDKK